MAVADGFHVDSIGNLWLGSNRETFDATTRSEAPFYVYANGDMVANSGTFAGTLSSGISISAPVITGGSISGTSGSFTGSISGASGTFTGDLSGSDITGGTIDIGSGTFTVDSVGAMVATSGTIGGWTIGSTDLSAGNISIDSGGTISGNYSASTGWRIQSDGSADFNNVNVRGDLLGVELKGDLDFNGGRLRTSTSGTRIEITDNNNLEGEIDFITSSGFTGKISADSTTQFLIENGVLSGKIKLALGSAQDEIELQATRINFSDPLGFNPIIEINGSTSTNKKLGVNSSGRLEFQTDSVGSHSHSESDISNIGNHAHASNASWLSGYASTSHNNDQHSTNFATESSVTSLTNSLTSHVGHSTVGTGISQINSPSKGFFSSYSFNSGTGAFSVSTSTVTSSSITVGNLFPNTSNGNLGFPTSSLRWKNLYLQNSPNVSSDERKKEDIEDLIYGLDYIKSLEPKSFKMKDREDEAINFGFIAQDLYTTPPEPNIDIALVEYTEDSDDYGVRYTELIAPLVKAIQELSAKNDELQSRIEELEG